MRKGVIVVGMYSIILFQIKYTMILYNHTSIKCLYNFLISHNINANIDASDRFSTIEYYGNSIKYFYDSNNNIIQIYFFNLFLGLKISNFFFISKLFFLFLKNFKTNKKTRKKYSYFPKNSMNILIIIKSITLTLIYLI